MIHDVYNVTKMDVVLKNIAKEQNRELITAIAAMYNLDEAETLRKYWTPTFYSVVPNDSKTIRVMEIRKSSKAQHADQPVPQK